MRGHTLDRGLSEVQGWNVPSLRRETRASEGGNLSSGATSWKREKKPLLSNSWTWNPAEKCSSVLRIIMASQIR